MALNVQAKTERTISIDTRYFGDQQNNHGFAEFGKEVIGLHNWAFTKVSSKLGTTESKRAYMLLGDYIVSSLLGSAFLTTYHEYGHDSRLEALGFEPKFKKRPKNFFRFFVEKLGSPYSSEATTYHYDEKKFTPKNAQRYFNKDSLNNDGKIMVSGAGLNNEMFFAGEMSNKIIEKRGEVTDFFFYLQGKMSTAVYSHKDSLGSDTKSLKQAYANKGYKINRRDMDRSNAISLFLSTSTYMYGASLYNYIKTGDTSVKAPTIYGIQIPDVESYYMRNGISYKVKSSYSWKDWAFPFSVEFIGKGKSKTDLKLGVMKPLPHFHNVYLKGDVKIGKGFGFGAEAIYAPLKNLETAVGFTHEDVRTFEGERNIGSLKDGNTENQVWARLSFKF